MRYLSILLCFICIHLAVKAQTNTIISQSLFISSAPGPSLVNFDAYEKLMKEVKKHRQSHLVILDSFVELSKQPDVIILDTRSDSMYKAKHIKGAAHLNFSDFTAFSLAKLIPNKHTRILIYCNNNFNDDKIYFVTKGVPPIKNKKPLTLALNIPTYINLFGYGYKNVYELSQTVSVFNGKLIFEGTAIVEKTKKIFLTVKPSLE